MGDSGFIDPGGDLLESSGLPANTAKRPRAWPLLERLKASPFGQSVALIRSDEGFAGADWENRVQAQFGWPMEIIRKPQGQVGFAGLPRCWMIEQIFDDPPFKPRKP